MNNSFIFVVQGEGRGHLTQAIALYEMLTAKGHQILTVLIGNSSEREIPAYVKERIQAPVISFKSPGFVTDRNHKSIQLRKTISTAIRNRKAYQKSMRLIRSTIDRLQPDMIINFYEPLIGLCSIFKKLHPNIISIAHQYTYLHPGYQFPEGSSLPERFMIQAHTRFTAIGSKKLLALSFYPFPDNDHKTICITPPLLRKELREHEVYQGRHFLIYLVNSGYMQDIINWSKEHPDIELHCFTDSKIVKGKWQYNEKLCFHSLDDRKFLDYMASSKGLITTAGFESVCEALFLNKPVMMVPVEKHFEQWCNSYDALKADAGIRSDSFQISNLIQYQSERQCTNEKFVHWCQEHEKRILQAFEEVLHESMEAPVADHASLPSMKGSHFQPGL